MNKEHSKHSAWSLIQEKRFQEAGKILDELTKISPDDVEVWCQLGAIHGQTGNIRDALDCFRRCIKLRPDFPEAHIGLATALQLQNDPKGAIQHLKIALKYQPDNVQALYCLGNAYKDLGRMDEAVECFGMVIRLVPGWAEARSNLAAALLRIGKINEAIVHFEEAVRIEPDNTVFLRNLAFGLLETPRLSEVEQIVNRLQSMGPDTRENDYILGALYLAKRKSDKAIEYIERVVLRDKDNAEAKANLSALYEKVHRNDDARSLGLQAIELEPLNARANLTLAKLDHRSGNLEEGAERLERLLDHRIQPRDKASILMMLGKMLDRLERYDEAFSAFEQGNNITANLIGFDPRNDGYLDEITALRKGFTSGYVAGWGRCEDDGGVPAPVFLVGFPRSGTTLTEQILASHPAIITGDELPIIKELTEELPALVESGEKYLDCLAGLSVENIAVLRRRYWELVRRHAGTDIDHETQTFVDKQPLNILQVGFIHRLFPDARIIVVLRDPRDACLSGFMQTFQPNRGMNYFLGLESAAQLYAATMDLWLSYEGILDLGYQYLYYESLTDDTEPAVRKLLEHAGVEWDRNVLDYWKKGNRRFLSTPSYQDISQPVYKRAVGRWRHYSSQLAPVIGTLQPFVEKFGYASILIPQSGRH